MRTNLVGNVRKFVFETGSVLTRIIETHVANLRCLSFTKIDVGTVSLLYPLLLFTCLSDLKERLRAGNG